jgi:signal transduction histidine kinase
MSSSSAFNSSLFAICQAMVSSLELKEVLGTILDLSVQEMKAQTGSILLYESGSEDLKMLASKGLPEEVVQRGHVRRKGSPAEYVIEHNEPLLLNDNIEKFNRLNKETQIRSSLCVPLRAKGQVIGTLNLNRLNADNGEFQEDDLQTLMILASQAAICIENARLYENSLKQERLAAIGQTVAGISHCVKNMLTGLRGGVGLVELSEQVKDWNTHAKGLEILKRNVDRIAYLVLDMLDFSKEKTPVRANVDVNTLIEDVYSTSGFKAREHSVELLQEITPECVNIFVDKDQIFRCLLNLVENAIDSIHGAGSVKTICREIPPDEILSLFGEDVSPDQLGRVVRLTVEDTGSGIDHENMNNLFQPFFSTKASKGTGLGLSVTRKIVEEHRGKIIVESEIGKGTSFHLVLPEGF